MDESIEAIETFKVQKHNIPMSDSNILSELNAQDTSPAKKSRNNEDSSDDDAGPMQRIKKRLQQFSDSDTEKENIRTNSDNENESLHQSASDNDSDHTPFKSGLKKSRIQMDDSSSNSDNPKEPETVKNEEQQLRMKNKKNKMQQKFKSLLNARSKSTPSQNLSDKQSSGDDKSEHSGSEASDNEMSSVAKIKQKIKKSMASMSSLCDPDTSDEEANMNNKMAPKQRQKKTQKSTKMIEAKPQRMSAKQAMENMQLIKSESNRMLREKSVSLPYHRPKALSLKDIMARRKPAVSSDGKALPIKMNKEQLTQYAQQLEERQKEMMELCKSESDEDAADSEPEENADKTSKEVSLPSESDTKALPPNNLEITNPEPDSSETNSLATVDTEFKDTNTNENIKTTVNADENKSSDLTDNADSEQINNIQEETDKTSLQELNTIETVNKLTEKPNDSIDSHNNSNTDIKLVYNDDSIEEEIEALENQDKNVPKKTADQFSEGNEHQELQKISSEPESQLISLQYTESNTDKTTEELNLLNNSPKANSEPEQDLEQVDIPNESSEQMDVADDEKVDDFFSDDDVNMEDIDKIIENAEIMKNDQDVSSPMLIKDPLTIKPKLTGAPGMVIDLDGSDATTARRSGVELLKERFTYFAKLKTPEEIEREKERRVKPGAQHLKLKQQLEEEIAEQRSMEWAKRLEEEKQLHQEMDAILDDNEEADDSIEKIKANLNKEDEAEENNSESDAEEEELVEDDVEMKDKPRKHNSMLDDEAEESDVEENDEAAELKETEPNEEVEDGEDIEEDGDDSEDSSEEEESSESEEEESSKPKKGRILKAFEDSEDEDTVQVNETETLTEKATDNSKEESGSAVQSESNTIEPLPSSCEVASASQDDVIQLAQQYKSASDDLFTSQENSNPGDSVKSAGINDELIGTQSFSISSAKPTDFLCPSQPYHDPNLNGITENFSQNVISSQLPSQMSQSQPIGEDILALCTGKFYDNEFVSQTDANEPTISVPKEYIDDVIVSRDNEKTTTSQNVKESNHKALTIDHISLSKPESDMNDKPVDDLSADNKTIATEKPKDPKKIEDGHLKSILGELDDPEFDNPKPNKFFTGGTQSKKEVDSSHMKKRFVIDSDDENIEAVDEGKKKKKLKKKKLEQRALQISDDEEEEGDEGFGLEDDDDVSDLKEDGERVVEYDSEENEIEVQPDKPKKKRKATDFLEQEAELTSEDEWVGSGDEDERDLDKMEREEGDDDVFHQGKLRKELGQIHMRDVLDQDKREVRLLQELLFEDGDLGGGHRQRKFRWRNEGDEEAGTVPNEFADTQEEEFESEEQWRKQRHEREVFLKQMQQGGKSEESMNVTVNRNTIIKANLSSKSMSALLMEVNQSKVEIVESPAVPEKKVVKDVPSPKKSFSIFQQNYHGSLLTRGRGALARLAALATPLAADDDAPNIGSLAPHKRNFVFAALTPDEEQPKVTIKRKADVNLGTPKLVKKMRIEEKKKPKSSLLDHLNL